MEEYPLQYHCKYDLVTGKNKVNNMKRKAGITILGCKPPCSLFQQSPAAGPSSEAAVQNKKNPSSPIYISGETTGRTWARNPKMPMTSKANHSKRVGITNGVSVTIILCHDV